MDKVYPIFRFQNLYCLKGGENIFSKKSLITLLITLVIVSVLFAIAPNAIGLTDDESSTERNKRVQETEDLGLEMIKNGRHGVSPKREDVDIKVGKETESGQVTLLPWDEDADFLQAKKDNGGGVLMAAYRTVLVDPLPGEEFNVHLAAKMLSGKIIESGEVFSQNREIGPYDESKGFREGPTYFGSQLATTVGGGVCKISSTLYNVAVLSNLEIVERHNHSMPVPYVPYGQDATVAYGGKDFQFRNNSPFPILVWSKGIGNTLYIAFYGEEEPPKVDWLHDVGDIRKADTIYNKNSELNPGVEKTVVEGMDGATVKSRITITWPDGNKETKDMGTSYYKPMPNVIERGGD